MTGGTALISRSRGDIELLFWLDTDYGRLRGVDKSLCFFKEAVSKCVFFADDCRFSLMSGKLVCAALIAFSSE